ncbi:MAG: 50S ribosomal protein L16 [Candidatus Micrarchaeaceae archaeon]
MKIRPGRSIRNPKNSQPWTRYSVRQPKKNYIKAMPRTSLLIFNMGTDKPEYDVEFGLVSKQDVQLRSNALEAARLVANKYLEREIPGNYFLKIVPYPHQVIREKKFATGAGADRLSQGMSMTFGKPIGVAARVRSGDNVFILKTTSSNRKIAREALERAAKKLSGKYSVSERAKAHAGADQPSGLGGELEGLIKGEEKKEIAG